MKTKIFLTLLAALSVNPMWATDETEHGKGIFKQRCASCHKIGTVFTGPDLANVDKRRSQDWIIKFVHSSQELIKKGDKDAVALFDQFNKIPMPDHQDLSHSDITSIVEYIKVESMKVLKDASPFKTPVVARANYKPISIKNYWFITVFLVVVGMLVGVLYFAVYTNTLKQAINNKQRDVKISSDAKAA